MAPPRTLVLLPLLLAFLLGAYNFYVAGISKRAKRKAVPEVRSLVLGAVCVLAALVYVVVSKLSPDLDRLYLALMACGIISCVVEALFIRQRLLGG